MSTQPIGNTKPTGLLNLALISLLLQALLEKTERPKRAQRPQAEKRVADFQELTADLKQLPVEELQNVLAYVQDLKRRRDALQGA